MARDEVCDTRKPLVSNLRGASLFLCAAPPFLISYFSFLIWIELSSTIKGQHTRGSPSPFHLCDPALSLLQICLAKALHRGAVDECDRDDIHDERGPAIRNEGQRDAGDRKAADDHRDIDDALHGDQHGESVNEKRRIGLLQLSSRSESGKKKNEVKNEDENRAYEAKFLTEDGIGKVGVLLGKVEKFRHAFADALPEESAGADRDEALYCLVAAVRRIGEGIPKYNHTVHAIGGCNDEKDKSEYSDPHAKEDLKNRQSRHDIEKHGKEHDHPRCPHVRLFQDEKCHHKRPIERQKVPNHGAEGILLFLPVTNMAEGTEKSLDKRNFLSFPYALGQKGCRPDQAGHFRDFRRLEREAREHDPARRAIRPMPGYNNEEEQHQGESDPYDSPTADEALRQPSHEATDGQTEHQDPDMLQKVGIRPIARRHIHIVGGIIDIHRPDGDQYGGRDEHPFQTLGHILRILQGRLATRRHMRFPFLENFSSYSVSTSPGTGAA